MEDMAVSNLWPALLHVSRGEVGGEGTSLFVIGPGDDEKELKDSVMEDMAVSNA
jgi:hypothetical protein